MLAKWGQFSLAAALLAGCSDTAAPNTQPESENASALAASTQWTNDTRAQLRQAIDARAAHGLDQMPFASDAADDAGSTQQALAYASALAHGATDPTKLYDIYTVPRQKTDLRAGLASALRAKDVKSWLAGLAPADANYDRLSKAYLALRRQPDAPAPAIPVDGEVIKPGATKARVATIARELVILDYLDQRAPRGDRYTPAMVRAVREMQADYGMKPDGIIGTAALAILNLSDVDRARAVAIAMERLRWLERIPPATRIDVNVAAARLTYWRDGKLADSRKVVVGESDRETPQLGSPIFRLVANPTWTIPRSIEEETAAKGAVYLKANNIARKNGWLVQQPGPKNRSASSSSTCRTIRLSTCTTPRPSSCSRSPAPAQPRLRPRRGRARLRRDLGARRRRDRSMAPGPWHRQGDVRQAAQADPGEDTLPDGAVRRRRRPDRAQRPLWLGRPRWYGAGLQGGQGVAGGDTRQRRGAVSSIFLRLSTIFRIRTPCGQSTLSAGPCCHAAHSRCALYP